jgi:murein DD-endopeptidase MepM/ murein hydrolase activator NlpD
MCPPRMADEPERPLGDVRAGNPLARAVDLGDPSPPRPLPSVSIPLLRADRRAQRVRHLAIAAAGGVLTLIGLVVLIWWLATGETTADERAGAEGETETETAVHVPSLGREPPVPEPHLAESDEPARPAFDSNRVERAFGQARGFRDALTLAGLAREEAGEIEEAMNGVMDFRRCRPEDRMVFERDLGGGLVRFEYHGSSATEYYQALREGASLRGERVEIPVERSTIRVGGVVTTSIGEALAAQGLGRSLVGAITEAFDGRANFATDTRRGDAFRLIVTEERIEGRFLRYGHIAAIEYVGQRTGTLRAFWFEEHRGEGGEFFDESGRSVQGGWLRTPVRYDRISSRFDPRRMHPILRRVVPHNGVDYAAGVGTPVWAAASGTVTFAGERGANGNLVSIRHEGGYETFYAHLSRIERGIEPGDEVERRQVIGYVGSTGRSTGPHLHFGLKRNGAFVDPLEQINGPGRMMSAGPLGRFRTEARRLSRELGAIDVEIPDDIEAGSAAVAVHEPTEVMD